MARDHSGNAERAAATAESTSSAVARASVVRVSPVAGFTIAWISPAPPTGRPSIQQPGIIDTLSMPGTLPTAPLIL
jgi:hypothetical protein